MAQSGINLSPEDEAKKVDLLLSRKVQQLQLSDDAADRNVTNHVRPNFALLGINYRTPSEKQSWPRSSPRIPAWAVGRIC